MLWLVIFKFYAFNIRDQFRRILFLSKWFQWCLQKFDCFCRINSSFEVQPTLAIELEFASMSCILMISSLNLFAWFRMSGAFCDSNLKMDCIRMECVEEILCLCVMATRCILHHFNTTIILPYCLLFFFIFLHWNHVCFFCTISTKFLFLPYYTLRIN